mmetsp:Transcript_26468/g.44191  ORF Transcript_26468/g.44191 Transcript_26468/m.44191 type:complete len:180 (-) Transcript_26468:215-754(-)
MGAEDSCFQISNRAPLWIEQRNRCIEGYLLCGRASLAPELVVKNHTENGSQRRIWMLAEKSELVSYHSAMGDEVNSFQSCMKRAGHFVEQGIRIAECSLKLRSSLSTRLISIERRLSDNKRGATGTLLSTRVWKTRYQLRGVFLVLWLLVPQFKIRPTISLLLQILKLFFVSAPTEICR